MPTEAKPKDVWDKADIVLKPVGGLLTALSVALVGFFGSQYLNRRQADDTNIRLYAQLMSSREAADTSLRRQMFDSIISTFLDERDSQDRPEEKVLALELLAYNFHDALDLAPLFKHVDAQVGRALGAANSDPARAGLSDGDPMAALRQRLSRMAREVTGKQLAALGDAGAIREKLVFFDEVDAEPAGKLLFVNKRLRLAQAESGREPTSFSLWVLDYSRERREVKVRLTVRPPGDTDEQEAVFWVGFYDFPMIDNTRLENGSRAAVVLRNWTDESAVIALAYFPGSRASLKEKPFYDEVIEDLVQAGRKLTADAGRGMEAP